METIEVDLPCVVTADLRLNAPRFAAVSAILKAKKAPIEARRAEDFGIQLSPRMRTLLVAEPSQYRAGTKVASVTELLDTLTKTEGLLT